MKKIEFSLHNEEAKKQFCNRIMTLDTRIHPNWVAKLFEDNSKLGRMRRGFHGVWLPYIAKEVDLKMGIRKPTKIWKEYFKHLYLWEKVLEFPDGTNKKVLISTEDLTTKEYAEFMEMIQIHCAQHFELALPELDPAKRAAKYA